MSSFAEHISIANRNQAVIGHLIQSESACAEWIATVAFYKALHVVEALFYDDADIEHLHSHHARAEKMKRLRKYQRLWLYYRILWQMSLGARYLSCELVEGVEVEYPTFADIIPTDEVRAKILDTCLAPFEAEAVRMIGASRREHGLVRYQLR